MRALVRIAAAPFLLLATVALAAETATQPSADVLVQAVKDSEQWIHEVESFYLKLDAGDQDRRAASG